MRTYNNGHQQMHKKIVEANNVVCQVLLVQGLMFKHCSFNKNRNKSYKLLSFAENKVFLLS